MTKIIVRTTSGKISTLDSAATTVGAANARTNRLGRDLRSSPGQLLAQNRFSCKMRWGCSGIYPVWSWKLLNMEAELPPWATCPTAWLSSWDLTVINIQPNPLLILCMPLVPRPPTMHHCEDPGFIFLINCLVSTGRLLLHSPWSYMFFRLNKIWFLSLSS